MLPSTAPESLWWSKPCLHHCCRDGENSTSNFSTLLPTNKHTNI